MAIEVRFHVPGNEEQVVRFETIEEAREWFQTPLAIGVGQFAIYSAERHVGDGDMNDMLELMTKIRNGADGATA